MTDAPTFSIVAPAGDGTRNPYRIEGPALLSISGGRTSGFMLRKIIDAHGGKLPRDVIPVFCNTGREHEATLIFLREMAERWSCPIVWLEYTHDGTGHGFRVVTFCTASREGEPFAAMIRHKQFLPNPVARFCTADLKVRTISRYLKSLGWDYWTNVIGIRADEPGRVAKARQSAARERWEVECPMHRAGHQEADVLAFWKAQPFDLMLPGGDNTFGNCDLCFLKGRAKIEKIMRTSPEAAEWWARQEEAMGSEFRADRPSYRQMLTQLTVQGMMFDDAIEDDTLPCQCTD